LLSLLLILIFHSLKDFILYHVWLDLVVVIIVDDIDVITLNLTTSRSFNISLDIISHWSL